MGSSQKCDPRSGSIPLSQSAGPGISERRRAMSTEWFIESKTGVSGPYTGGKLKALAAEGRVSQSDLIRQGADGKPVPASRIKGLFVPLTDQSEIGTSPSGQVEASPVLGKD